MLLLRLCHNSQMNHLARSVAPTFFSTAAQVHDNLTRKTFCSILYLECVNDAQWLRTTLPVRKGCFRLSSIVKVSPAAYLAAWLHSLSVLPTRFPLIRGQVEKTLCDSSEEVTNSHLHGAFDKLPANSTEDDKRFAISDLLDHPDHLQKRLWSKQVEITVK